MNNSVSVKETVIRLLGDIAPEADIEGLDPNIDMRDELDLDSMDFMRLLEGLEKELGISISESDSSKLNTLQNLVDYISELK